MELDFKNTENFIKNLKIVDFLLLSNDFDEVRLISININNFKFLESDFVSKAVKLGHILIVVLPLYKF